MNLSMYALPKIETAPSCIIEEGVVLLASSDPDWMSCARASLNCACLKVIAARTDDAIEAARRHAPDLIISDASNAELCRALKQQADMAAIPILILSNPDDAGLIEAVEAGADDWLPLTAPGALAIKKVERLIAETRNRRKGKDACSASEIERLKENLIHSERLATLGQLVSGVAHELNNPLTSVIGYTQLLLTTSTVNGKAHEWLEVVNREAERTRRIVQNLLSFSRQHKSKQTQVDINELLENTLELRAYEMRVNNIRVERQMQNIPKISADAHKLQQVFLNIIVNAEQAINEGECGGAITIKSQFYSAEGRERVRVEIADDGPGIAPEHINKLFEPFFTTKPAGKGTGLGLSISREIIEAHNGTIRVESAPGRGADFIIELPVRRDGALTN
ncbi:MAG TPA: ATP-binding protein [Blastocatellia bacterium]|nr:ATP-binding protein [Blastocatellia bacterium]